MSKEHDGPDLRAVISQLEAAARSMGFCTLALNNGRRLDARVHVSNALRALHTAQDDLRYEDHSRAPKRGQTCG